MNYLKRKLRAMMNTSVVVPSVDYFITFSCGSTFSIKTSNTSKNWNGTIEYSTDKINWSTWNGTIINGAASNGNYYIYLRGINNTYINTSSISSKGAFVFTTSASYVYLSGNIDNLLDYATVANGSTPTMASYCFFGLFINCSKLASLPSFPFRVLSDYCYAYMFYNCTSLTELPSLPSTNLKQYCYSNMFYGCSKIKMSNALTGIYINAYRVPSSGTGTQVTGAVSDMFGSTGGTIDVITINTIYYTSASIVS